MSYNPEKNVQRDFIDDILEANRELGALGNYEYNSLIDEGNSKWKETPLAPEITEQRHRNRYHPNNTKSE